MVNNYILRLQGIGEKVIQLAIKEMSCGQKKTFYTDHELLLTATEGDWNLCQQKYLWRVQIQTAQYELRQIQHCQCKRCIF